MHDWFHRNKIKLQWPYATTQPDRRQHLGRLLSKLHVVQLPLVSLASAGFSLEDCCITLRSQTLEVQQQLQLTTGSFISPSQHVLEKESI